MIISSDDLVAQFQRDWPKEFEISYRRLENSRLRAQLDATIMKEANGVAWEEPSLPGMDAV